MVLGVGRNSYTRERPSVFELHLLKTDNALLDAKNFFTKDLVNLNFGYF